MTSRVLFEYCSAIHIHSTYSDGTGDIPQILNAAKCAGLDLIILTDHNSLQGKTDGWEGWHDNVLLMVGEEVSARKGHCLAFGTQTQVNHRQPLAGIVDDILVQDGLAFLAHPHGAYRPFLKRRDHSWQDWSVEGYTGLELWSYMFDWVKELRYHRFFEHYNNPDAHISGPFPETVQMWDQLCQTRRLVALGGVDVHASRYPFLPFVVFPYEHLFRKLRTYFLLDHPLTGNAEQDIPRILHALREGHCFIAYDLLSKGAGTRFGSTDGVLQMGDECTFEGPLELEVRLPAQAELLILRNGRPFLHTRNKIFSFRAETPGVYRVEARRDGKPWIFTNPIYLRPGA